VYSSEDAKKIKTKYPELLITLHQFTGKKCLIFSDEKSKVIPNLRAPKPKHILNCTNLFKLPVWKIGINCKI
jgi:hypothetical protein